MPNDWEVLNDLEQLNLDSVKEPPCGKCYWWDPAFEYDETGRVGVAFCRCEQMECDFSCFRPLNSKAPRAKRTSSPRAPEPESGKDPQKSQD